jgi:hypothetical protein
MSANYWIRPSGNGWAIGREDRSEYLIWYGAHEEAERMAQSLATRDSVDLQQRDSEESRLDEVFTTRVQVSEAD